MKQGVNMPDKHVYIVWYYEQICQVFSGKVLLAKCISDTVIKKY